MNEQKIKKKQDYNLNLIKRGNTFSKNEYS